MGPSRLAHAPDPGLDPHPAPPDPPRHPDPSRNPDARSVTNADGLRLRLITTPARGTTPTVTTLTPGRMIATRTFGQSSAEEVIAPHPSARPVNRTAGWVKPTREA